ncbi:GGDEF domain-containing protein [Pigmentiphaga aceris]|uniref:diguanylate cyclase n=1 Tax=Pigmentiphaga aceris TaxID=1940612 RepID=A0A5C0AY22_9BURK|nr:GGDEF domain-containing protein [Pigmentiphaga aceris]QEI07065.1 GGDEF domain-containing protein [Pigmentiphaga aceris]
MFEQSNGILSPYDVYAYPVILTLLVTSVCMLLIRNRPKLHRAAEYLAFGGLAIYIVIGLQYFILRPDANSIYAVANTLQWMPILYIAGFAFFPKWQAIIGCAAVFLLSSVTPLGVLLFGRDPGWDLHVGALLVNGYASHLLVLLCMSMMVALRTQISKVSEHARLMENAAYTDDLTGTANRRGMERVLQERGNQLMRPVALLLFDIDHFKLVNDRFGHRIGDEVLASIAQLIKSQLRPGDTIYRWGGEEFLVVASGTGFEAARSLAERVRHIVSASVHPVAGTATVSVGVSTCSGGESLEVALQLADEALYLAKEQGRNRVSTR